MKIKTKSTSWEWNKDFNLIILCGGESSKRYVNLESMTDCLPTDQDLNEYLILDLEKQEINIQLL